MDERVFFRYKDIKYSDDKGLDFGKHIREIYQHIGDEQSVEIFTNRLMYSLTTDFKYIHRIIHNSVGGRRFKEKVGDGSWYIYGAGIRGQRLVFLYPDIKWRGFIDRKSQTSLCGLKVNNLKEIDLLGNINVVISNVSDIEAITKELITHRNINKIIICNEINEEVTRHQYFDSEIFRRENKNIFKRKTEKGYFLDIGCYDGDTAIRYLDFTCQRSKIIAFEPEPNNYRRCIDALNGYENIKVFPFACASENKEVEIISGGEASTIKVKDIASHENYNRVRAIKVDSFVKDPVGFIKIDIEGAEEDAILGGTEVIRDNMPIMALSIYHKREDIWRLPSALLDISDKWKFYFRHYSMGLSDTVFYAIPQNG